MSLHVAEPLAEAPEASERAFLARVVEFAPLVQTGRETHHLAQAIDDHRRPLIDARDHHVEAVRTEVDRGQDLGRLLGGRWLRLGEPRGPQLHRNLRRRTRSRSRRSSRRSDCG